MKYISGLIVGTVLFLVIGCRHTPKEGLVENSSQAVIIKPDYSKWSVVDISPYLDTIKYVKLEFTDQSMIGEISKIEAYKDRLYILDMNTSSLFVFTMDGKYLFKIHSVGSGPQEYTQLDFLSIDKEQQNIVLTDLMGYWIMRYDMEGNFLSRQKIPFWVEGVGLLPGKKIALYANYRNNKEYLDKEYNLICIDSLNNILKVYYPYDSSWLENYPISVSRGEFYDYQDICNFYSLYNDTIFRLSSKGLQPRYIFDMQGKSFNQAYFKKPADEFVKYMKESKFYYLTNVFETKEILSFTMDYGFDAWVGYYSKKSGKIINAAYYQNKKQYFMHINRGVYDPWFISVVPIEALLTLKENYSHHSSEGIAQKEILSLLDTLKEEDNPVLMMYKFKDF
ncbi:6-bladed beta-propeller [Parabacteroides pacaensis]|uniref:6-bladed beta-propeller n=1 Tax=Parabacteroides pacaensis TaxID=2086575 RepID=UPI000D0E44C8|nr:6-bladed beta-propeller [Parabacteroides pacaensis]